MTTKRRRPASREPRPQDIDRKRRVPPRVDRRFLRLDEWEYLEKKKRRILLAAAVSLLLILYFSLAPGFPQRVGALLLAIGIDTEAAEAPLLWLGHALVYAVVTVGVGHLIDGTRGRIVLALGVIATGTIVEFLQTLALRTFENEDLLSNLAGVLVGLLLLQAARSGRRAGDDSTVSGA